MWAAGVLTSSESAGIGCWFDRFWLRKKSFKAAVHERCEVRFWQVIGSAVNDSVESFRESRVGGYFRRFGCWPDVLLG
jgi:hypothetical protein